MSKNPRGRYATLLSDEQYRYQYVLGKYSPTPPGWHLTARARRKAVKKGLCNECRKREKDGELTHCRVCLDRRADARKTNGRSDCSSRAG